MPTDELELEEDDDDDEDEEEEADDEEDEEDEFVELPVKAPRALFSKFVISVLAISVTPLFNAAAKLDVVAELEVKLPLLPLSDAYTDGAQDDNKSKAKNLEFIDDPFFKMRFIIISSHSKIFLRKSTTLFL